MVLFQVGLLQIEVAPFSITDFERTTGAEFAAKAVIGGLKPREFTGEADDEICFRGKLFPHFSGGLDALDLAERMSRGGDPQMVVRGDGKVFGWYFFEKLVQKHGVLDAKGIGREIAHDIKLVKSPSAPSAASMLATIFGLFG